MEKLSVLRDLLYGFDYLRFIDGDDLEKSKIITGAVNFIIGKSVAERDVEEKDKTQNIYLKEALLLRQALSLCSSIVDDKLRMEAAFLKR